MSEEDRRAIEMALREEEEAVGGGGGMAYDGGRDGALGMTRAQRNELPGAGTGLPRDIKGRLEIQTSTS